MFHFIIKKTAMAVIVFLTLIFICAGSAFASFTIEKIGDKGLYPQPDGDRHNSYSWCMGILHHADGDYLYVGSNRDIAYLTMAGLFRTIDPTANFATITSDIQNFFGGDVATYASVAEVDLRARIFRLKLDGTSSWELFYTAPTVLVQGQPVPLEMGYRGMQVFTDTSDETDLYVVTDAGATKVSRVLKISQNTGAIKEVFRISGTASLRPIAVHEGKLYIGANNDIYEASNPEAQADWTKVATDASFGGLIASGRKAMLWQFTSFNGYLYAALSEDVDPAKPQTADNGGAWLFKGKYDGSNWVWTPIVADQTLFTTAPYPKGFGNRFNTTFSIASFQDNLYVGTLMTFPSLIATGNMGLIFQNRIPPQIYRFDESDVCSMVIGDTAGSAKSTVFTSRIGNYGAGFFNPGILQLFSPDLQNVNFSLNQYLWWMAEYKGKLYASTFDLRIFLKYMTRPNLESMGVITPGPDGDAAWQNMQTMLQAIDTYNDNPAGCDIFYTSDGVTWNPLTRDGFGDQFNYGGRILLPSTDTGNTLYIGMANPFYGAQVYALEDTGDGISSSGSGGCFIATAAYGSSFDPHVKVLRAFRDRFLLATAPGRSFVRLYYSISPTVARFLERHEGLKPFVRLGLLPIVGICYLFVNGFGALAILFFALILMAPFMIHQNRRRHRPKTQECT